MAARQVRALLMGGQACVFYGAAEFSRDTDLLIRADAENLQRLSTALQDLQAECIAVPPFAAEYLERGHAIHFRCHHSDAADMRVDVMSKLRGVDLFPTLWERRTTLSDNDGTTYELLALPDLVQAKKTQRSKDWPMLQRLVEAHYLQHRAAPTPERQQFWLLEMRTPELLCEVAQAAPAIARELEAKRPLLCLTVATKAGELESGLADEERAERERDRIYWQPLKAELEQLRHAARKH
jgi:hypothetical protein